MTTGRCWTVGPRPEFALAGVSSTRCRLQAICLPRGSCLGQDCAHPLRARDITRINRWAPPDFVSSQTIKLPGYSKHNKVTTHTCASANMPDRRSVMFLLHGPRIQSATATELMEQKSKKKSWCNMLCAAHIPPICHSLLPPRSVRNGMHELWAVGTVVSWCETNPKGVGCKPPICKHS